MLRDALGRQFQRSLPEYLDGMITIASVKMSPDLRIAKVYVSIYRSATTPDILIKRMNTHMPEIRKRLAGEVEMKYVPELRFYRDDTLDAAERIDELLRAVRHDDEARRPEQPSDDETNDGETGGDDDA
jgi:ribosome-binding factor A